MFLIKSSSPCDLHEEEGYLYAWEKFTLWRQKPCHFLYVIANLLYTKITINRKPEGYNLARCGSHKPTLWSYILIFVYQHCHYYTFKCQLFPWCLAICVSAEVIELLMCHERIWGKWLHCFPFNAVQKRLFNLCAQDVWGMILKHNLKMENEQRFFLFHIYCWGGALRCKIKTCHKNKTALTYANSNLPKLSLWQIVW